MPRIKADKVVVEFLKAAVRTGSTRRRVFDALNDHRNLITAIMATKTFNGHAEAVVAEIARYPDRTGVTLREYPEAVLDTAWGNKLFRRTFWDSVMGELPATEASGLDE